MANELAVEVEHLARRHLVTLGAFVPISTIAYSTLPRDQNGDAAVLFSMARNVFGGLGTSISTALFANHEQIRQADLAEHLTPGN